MKVEDTEAEAREWADEQMRREILAWIEVHGSERLKLAVQCGVIDMCHRSYADERLALEEPGAIFCEPSFSTTDVSEPSLEALRIFARMRETHGDAELIRVAFGEPRWWETAVRFGVPFGARNAIVVAPATEAEIARRKEDRR